MLAGVIYLVFFCEVLGFCRQLGFCRRASDKDRKKKGN